MKFINSRNFLVLFLAVCSIGEIQAQEIISDTVKKQEAPKSSFKRQKIDGVVATVGDYIVLDSDIDKNFLELSSQGNSIEGITRCEMLGNLLEQRLYAHQALQDSIVVKDAEINSLMEEKIGIMLEQTRGGTMDDIVKYYKKNSEEEFRTYFFEILKMNKLTTEMTNAIIEKVEITPEEVRTFFKGIKKEELPVFGDELEISQIVIRPKITEAEKQKVKDRLNEFKSEIAAGSSFYSKAVLYSQDPGSKSNGGFMKVNRKTPLVKEFKDVAFSLDEGQISEPFETEFGFHIVYIEKIRGQDVDLRHILIAPKISEESLKEAKEEALSIRKKIVDGEISFADAARSSSDEKETKANGGALLNPKSLDSRFELTKLDAMLYGQVSNLKTGEVSLPFLDEPRSGGKVYKLMMVTNRIASHTADYSTDYIKIKEFALKDKQIKEIAKWTEERIKQTYIKINGEYRDCEFVNNWLKK